MVGQHSPHPLHQLGCGESLRYESEKRQFNAAGTQHRARSGVPVASRRVVEGILAVKQRTDAAAQVLMWSAPNPLGIGILGQAVTIHRRLPFYSHVVAVDIALLAS
jgi:hypothetical protein